MARRRRRAHRLRFDRLDDRRLPSVAVPGLTPAQVDRAYGFAPYAANGAGQTIAIIDAFHDPNLARELAVFDRQFGLAPAGLTQLGQYGGAAGGPADDGWAAEESLDAEWAHEAAPGAKLVVVEANSDNLDDLLAAVDTARHIPGVSVVAMSWGGSEFAGETADDAYFTTPAGHTPITFLAATGDDGAATGANWPASSPNVIAVGGTSLAIDTAGNYQYETAWYGGGGGYSAFEPEPGYQKSVQSTGVKATPDVAVDGDPNSGVATYGIAPSTGRGGWSQVGGTSVSTQIWAGIIAVADQVRVNAVREPTLGTAAALNDLYNSSGAFNDVTFGNNGFNATPGFDLATGLGSPRQAYAVLSLLWPGTSAATTQAATIVAARLKAPPHKAAAAFLAATADVPTAAVAAAAPVVAPVGVAPAAPAQVVGNPAPAPVLAAGATSSPAPSPSGAASAPTAVPQAVTAAPAFAAPTAPRSNPAPWVTPDGPADLPIAPEPPAAKPAAPAEADADAMPVGPAVPAPDSAPAPGPERAMMPPDPAPANRDDRRGTEADREVQPEAPPRGEAALASLGGGLILTIAVLYRWGDRPRFEQRLREDWVLSNEPAWRSQRSRRRRD